MVAADGTVKSGDHRKEKLLKTKGHDIVASSTGFKVLDCYTDPLGWKNKLVNSGSIGNAPLESSLSVLLVSATSIYAGHYGRAAAMGCNAASLALRCAGRMTAPLDGGLEGGGAAGRWSGGGGSVMTLSALHSSRIRRRQSQVLGHFVEEE